MSLKFRNAFYIITNKMVECILPYNIILIEKLNKMVECILPYNTD